MSISSNNELWGLVLAGGLSSRMGCDKASLVHPDGRTLVRRAYDLLREVECVGVVLSLRAEQEFPAGFADLQDVEVVRDPAGDSQGPMAGMVAAMRARPTADWLVVACDLPRLDRATLERLADERSSGENFVAFRSESDGMPEPLCALYLSGSLPILEKALADDFRCPRKILIRHGCRLLDPVTAGALDNANTPEDWEIAIRS